MAWLLNQALQGSRLKTKAITLRGHFKNGLKFNSKNAISMHLVEMKFWSGKSVFSIQN